MVGPIKSIHSAPADSGDVYALPSRYRSPLGVCQLALKRLIDVIAAAIGLAVLAPVFGVIALLVVVKSGRPIFFRWNVMGRHGKPFTGFKFRTMLQGAEALQEGLAQQNEMSGPVFKMRRDPRVTRIGRILRRYSLDELPQLWSVLKGDMSLVGPRPPLQREWEQYEPWQRSRLAVTPGITCLWQVAGRADIRDFNRWVALDLEYIKRWSLWLDLQILGKTVVMVLTGRGAY